VSLTFKDVAEIIKIVDASSCDELIVEIAGAKIVVRRNGRAGEPSPSASALAPPRPESAPPAAVPPGAAPAAAGPKVDRTARSDGRIEIRSPMVGTFYRAPSPKDAPFVEVGTVVKPGDPLCLVEVMKLYTTITADRAGRIAEILPPNAQLVEYDQVLFVMEPM
jgi:acetyl-CoA carboxylase biotin carboxyl carrier protein